MQLNPFHRDFLTTRRSRRFAEASKGLMHYQAVITHVVPKSNILKLCQKHGTDKGATNVKTHACGGLAGRNKVHHYAPFYDFLFAPKQFRVKNLLECGIGSTRDIDGSMAWASDAYKPGASLRMWRDYFPNAQIVGLDYDKHALFSEERIATYLVDQTDPASIAKFKAECDRTFDIIIDDGLHTPFAGITLFNNMIDRLAQDGVYVIEDLNPKALLSYRVFFTENPEYFVRFVTIPKGKINGEVREDALAVITKHY